MTPGIVARTQVLLTNKIKDSSMTPPPCYLYTLKTLQTTSIPDTAIRSIPILCNQPIVHTELNNQLTQCISQPVTDSHLTRVVFLYNTLIGVFDKKKDQSSEITLPIVCTYCIVLCIVLVSLPLVKSSTMVKIGGV